MNKPLNVKPLPAAVLIGALISLALALPRLLNALGRKRDRIEFGHRKSI